MASRFAAPLLALAFPIASPGLGQPVPPAAPPPGGPPPPPAGPAMRPPPPPAPDPSAHFRLRRGDTEIDIRCAMAEPMRACVEAATSLLAKVQGLPPAGPPPTR